MVDVVLEFCQCVEAPTVVQTTKELLDTFRRRAAGNFSVKLQAGKCAPCHLDVKIDNEVAMSSRALGRRPRSDEIIREVEKRSSKS